MEIAGQQCVVRLGTRGSLLARMQSQLIADELERRHPSVKVELVICKTTGDKIQDRPLHEAGGKGLFTKELEEWLLGGQVDFAVHSYKDVPVTMPLVNQANLVIAAVPAREDPRDVMVSPLYRNLRDLPQGARVGTGSLRRQCQILAMRPDLHVEMIRGNIDTRLKKMKNGHLDTVILAAAGLRRSGMFNSEEMTAIATHEMLPAAAQGALALQCRRDDMRMQEILAALHDPATSACVELERAVVQELNGDCHSPIAALATIAGDRLTLHAAVGARGGRPPVVKAQAEGRVADAQQVLAAVVSSLRDQHGIELLAGEHPAPFDA